MEIIFLGTCAADFSARLKNECKDRFDYNARRASCALLDGRYLIDCGPHVLDSLRIAGIGTEQITDVFITHFHSDHYNPKNLAEIAPERVWVREDAVIDGSMFKNTEILRMEDCRTYNVTPELTVTGLKANHDESVFPRHLVFEKNGKKLFYGLDGGWMLNKTYCFLRNAGFDAMIMDATCGDYVGDYRMGEHNSIPMLRLMVPSFRTAGLVKDNTKIYLSHLAPSLHKTHEETVEIVREDGFIVAYDGLKITV